MPGGPFPPGPRYLTPYGFGSEVRRDPLGYTLRAAREFGDIVGVRMGPWRMFLLFHPEYVRHVLQDANHKYVKGALVARSRPLIGNGLFSSEGDFWRRQRRLAQPAFHRQRIEAFAGTMVEATSAMLERWQRYETSGVAFDVVEEMSSLTLGIVGRTLFSMDLSGDAADVGRAMLGALDFLNRQGTSFFYLPVVVPTPGNLRFLQARRTLDRVVYGIIESRRRNGNEGQDFLGLLLAARDQETGESMNDRQLRDEVMTFVLAGHETTAMALSWTWYLLARHPEIEERARREVWRALGARVPTMGDLGALGYIRMVVQEAMRLYPPLWGFVRESVVEDEIAGFRIAPRTVVAVSPYATHRHPAFWEEPERFDPERFTPEAIAARPRYAYFPFSGGPRQCIGNEFALMEATIVAAMVLQRFRLQLADDRVIEPEVRLTLRPRGGLQVCLRSVPELAQGTVPAGDRALEGGAPSPPEMDGFAATGPGACGGDTTSAS